MVTFAGTGLLLLIACLSVANLFLARGAARRREFGVRLAIGASRSVLIRQLLIESALVLGLAAILGFLVAQWASHLLLSWLPQTSTPIVLALDLDSRVLLFHGRRDGAYGVARRHGPSPASMLGSGEASAVPGTTIWRGGDVVVQKDDGSAIRGLPPAYGAARLSRDALHLAADDSAVFFGTVLVIIILGTIAGWLPARTAARVDPVSVLRAR